MDIKSLFPGVYLVDGKLATVNLARGRKVYNEDLIDSGATQYRLWNPYRSKLAAAILNGMKHMEIKDGSSVLYIGAATGTTASHVSDIIGKSGRVYALELSERNMRNLIPVCESRGNMLPLLADARYPERYSEMLEEVDVMYQDASAREQAKMLLANSRFLKRGGYCYFIIKSQSVDISRKPSEVFESELSLLAGAFEIVEKLSIEPYDSMHLFVVLRKL